MRRHLNDGDQRVHRTQREEDGKDPALCRAKRCRHTADRGGRQHDRPNRDPELVHRSEEQRRKGKRGDRAPELGSPERLHRKPQEPIGHRKATETFSSAYHLVLTAVFTSVTAFAVLAIEPAVRSMSVSSL